MNLKKNTQNSLYMLYEEVEVLLDSRGSSIMEEVRESTIKEIIDFLAPFEEATNMLEEERQSTLPLVIQISQTELNNHFMVMPADAWAIAAGETGAE